MFLATAVAVAGSAVAGSAIAQDHGGRWERVARSDRSDRSALTAHQLAAEADVSIARMKADLRLTADQEKNWSGMETALRDIGQRRAERAVAFRAEGAKQDGKQDGVKQEGAKQESAKQDSSDDFIASLSRASVSLSERSADMKKLADAAQPLYVSLDAQQKRRFSQALMRVIRDD
jgi:hypothetical protein